MAFRDAWNAYFHKVYLGKLNEGYDREDARYQATLEINSGTTLCDLLNAIAAEEDDGA